MREINFNNDSTSPLERQRIFDTLSVPRTPLWTGESVQALVIWQGWQKIKADGLFGPETRRKMERHWSAVCVPCDGPIKDQEAALSHPTVPAISLDDLAFSEKLRLCAYTFIHESGRGDEAYAATNLNGEYRGFFDRPKGIPVEQRTTRHWASRFNKGGGAMIGLSYGRIQHTQDGGGLGKVLRRARELGGAEFDAIIDANKVLRGGAPELIEVTCRGGGIRVNARSPRVQPVKGVDLWEQPWVSTLKAMAAKDWMRQAQDERMFDGYLDPMITEAKRLGITRHALIAIMFDVAVQFGKSGAIRFLDLAFGKIKPTLGGSDSDIERLIATLPADLRERRRNILRAADKTTHYSIP